MILARFDDSSHQFNEGVTCETLTISPLLQQVQSSSEQNQTAHAPFAGSSRGVAKIKSNIVNKTATVTN